MCLAQETDLSLRGTPVRIEHSSLLTGPHKDTDVTVPFESI